MGKHSKSDEKIIVQKSGKMYNMEGIQIISSNTMRGQVAFAVYYTS